MGYYSSFNLKVKTSEKENDTDIINHLRAECDYAEWGLDEEGDSYEPCKWYDCDKDIKNFSKNYPDALFTMDIEGEESGDIRRFYVKDGKIHNSKVEIVFEEFNPEKLK